MKEKEKMIDGGIFDKKAILAICEGVRKEKIKIHLPNFHAIQYYVEVPSPEIVGKILDFGLTTRTFLKRKLEINSLNVREVRKYLNKSFEDMVKAVIDYIFELFWDDKLDELYKFAIPCLFREDVKYNPWKDFIEESRKKKIAILKSDLNKSLVNFLQSEIELTKDEKQKKMYKKIILELRKEEKKMIKKVLNDLEKTLFYTKTINFYKDLFNQPSLKDNYKIEIMSVSFILDINSIGVLY